MEKKKKLKNRVLAGFLALTLSGATPVLVKGEGLADTTVDITTIIQNENSELDELLNEDNLSLEEEYLAYLKDNDISVTNGNIEIKNVQQFEKIRDYYKNYFEENGYFKDLEYYLGWYYGEEYGKDALLSLNIFLLNFNEMSDDLKRELIHLGIVKIDENFDYIIDDFAYIIYEYNYKKLPNGDSNFIKFSPIVFNGKLRRVYSMIENDFKKIGSNASNNFQNIEAIGNKYLTYFYDDGKTYEPNFFTLDDCAQLYLYYYFQPLEYILKEQNYEYLYFIGDLGNYYDYNYITNDFRKEIEDNLVSKENKSHKIKKMIAS